MLPKIIEKICYQKLFFRVMLMHENNFSRP